MVEVIGRGLRKMRKFKINLENEDDKSTEDLKIVEENIVSNNFSWLKEALEDLGVDTSWIDRIPEAIEKTRSEIEEKRRQLEVLQSEITRLEERLSRLEKLYEVLEK